MRRRFCYQVFLPVNLFSVATFVVEGGRLKIWTILPVCLLVLVTSLEVPAASIINSKHDLSHAAAQTGDHGLGGLEQYNEVCVYCHTPHGANTANNGPLWNKNFNTDVTSYTLYKSATLDTTPSPPGKVSLLCLNCHDGSTGVSAVRNPPNSGWVDTVGFVGHSTMTPGQSFGECGLCHTPGGLYGGGIHFATHAYMGTDLGDDHPIGIGFPAAAVDNGFNLPPTAAGWTDVPLFAGKIECSTCHDVHDPQNVPFLNVDNSGSALCLRCHRK